MIYGFIGLGNLGGALALNLAKAGFELVVFDRDEAVMAPLVAAGAEAATSAEEVARRARHLVTCLPSPDISRQVLEECGPHLVKLGFPDDRATWIEMSTIGRDDVIDFAARAEELGIDMLELPVTGGVHLAARGEITLLVGGDQAVFDRHEPALKAMGNRVFHMGPLGSAALIKVITNMLAFIHLKASSEALMLAKRGGLDLATAYEAIKASSGTSFVHETEGALILNGSYDIAFSMDLALKDLGFAMAFGREYGVPLELAALTEQTYVEAKAAYGGEAQSPMIARLLEDRLKTDLRADGYPAKLV